jgi:hypothetical protein
LGSSASLKSCKRRAPYFYVMLTMAKHIFYFRPGEEKRMLARCQFGLSFNGTCGATLTYPIKGYPWRRNIMKSFGFPIDEETKKLLFEEVRRLKKEFPEECLSREQLWSDSSEKANGITRDRATNTLCYTVGIMVENEKPEEYYAIRENSPALLESHLFKIISKLIEPYEAL